jgi:hypothetical protein
MESVGAVVKIEDCQRAGELGNYRAGHKLIAKKESENDSFTEVEFYRLYSSVAAFNRSRYSD